jgi:hypothetical protein
LPPTQLIAGYRISEARAGSAVAERGYFAKRLRGKPIAVYRGVAITVSCCAVAIGGRISKAVRGRYGGVSKSVRAGSHSPEIGTLLCRDSISNEHERDHCSN